VIPSRVNLSPGIIDPNSNHSSAGLQITKPLRRKSDFTGTFLDSSEQVAILEQKSERVQKIDKMRFVANSDRRGSVVIPRSNARYETLYNKDNRVFAPMTPSSFKNRNSQDLLKDPSRYKTIQTLGVMMGSKSKFAGLAEDTNQNLANNPLENDASDSSDLGKDEIVCKDSKLSHMNTPVEEADEWSSPGKSESVHKDSSRSYTKTSLDREVLNSSDQDTS
jgi:hypothetical protein